jgi:hypothetical protein
MKSIIEFIIMMVLALIYFNVILPYYINDFNTDFNNDFNNNLKNNLANENNENYVNNDLTSSKDEVIKNCTNISSYSNQDILFDKINYTNNNIYIQI